MNTRKLLVFALPLMLLLVSFLPQSTVALSDRVWHNEPQDPSPGTDRPADIKLGVLPDAARPPASVERALAPNAAVTLELDDNQHDIAYGVNNNIDSTAKQFIWLNRFTPSPGEFPFTLNQVWVLFDDFGALDIDVGDAIDLVIYQDDDGDPTNGATWLATFNETIQAVDGSTWSVYNLSTPITLSGPGDVLIGVIDRFVTTGVTAETWPATLDTDSEQDRSFIGWWDSDPPDPATLPPDNTFDLMTGTEAGNWMIRGYGETSTSDETGPNIGAPAYTSYTPSTDPATVTASISDAATGGNGVSNATLYYGYSSPYNQNSVAGTGPGGNGDGTWSFTIPAQGAGNDGQTLYFYVQACDDDTTSACSTNNNGGSYYPLLISSQSPDMASFPFYDGFESGDLGTGWSEYVTEEGRVQVSSDYPYSGTYSLLLDDSVDNTTYSYAAAILAIDLNGETDVELDFWWREFDDEVQAEEGVYISDDSGTTWHKVYSFDGDTTDWHNAVVDIDAAAAANSLTLNDRFQIKLQFYDNYSIDPDPSEAADGYAIDEVRVHKPPFRIYLSMLLKDAGPPTSAPVLNPIDNPTGDYDYTVTWNTVDKTTEYTLEEDDNAGFSSPATVYQGSSTTRDISGKDLGTYYYRVKASNDFGETDWSNIESITVTVEKPPCPQAGSWSGTTNQGHPISFAVVHSPNCHVDDLQIKYYYTCTSGSYFTVITTFGSTQSIINDHFDTGGDAPNVQGDFTSTTAANGTWSYSGWDPYNPWSSCSGSGTWSATYSP